MSLFKGSDVTVYRERRSMSYEDLASILGTNEEFIRQLEVGIVEIKPELEAILIVVGVEPGMGEDMLVIPTAVRVLHATEEVLDDPEPAPEAEPEVDRNDGIRRVSNSEVQTFKECKRKWWLAWYRGLAEKKQPVIGTMMIGNRLHRALEKMYAPGGPYYEDGLLAMEAVIEDDRKLMGLVDDVTAKQFEDESNLERIMLQGYVEWAQENGADTNLEVIASEQYVEADLQPFAHSGGLKIIGRLDVQVRLLSNGERRFVDHKTVGAFQQIRALGWMTEQPKHYQLLNWMTADPDERVGGMIYNMLRRVKRTAHATPPFYERLEVTHNRVAMENYYDRLVSEIWEIIGTEHRLESGRESHQEVVPPTISQKCTWGCPFLQVCSMFDDGSRVEDAITEHYEVVDPLSYYDKPKETE